MRFSPPSSCTFDTKPRRDEGARSKSTRWRIMSESARSRADEKVVRRSSRSTARTVRCREVLASGTFFQILSKSSSVKIADDPCARATVQDARVGYGAFAVSHGIVDRNSLLPARNCWKSLDETRLKLILIAEKFHPGLTCRGAYQFRSFRSLDFTETETCP